MTKICRTCNMEKTLYDFPVHHKTRKYISNCRKCENYRRNENQKKHRKSIRKRSDLTGQRFGRLLVIESLILNGQTCSKCICDCGKEKITRTSRLIEKRGPLKSCGCLVKESGKISARKRKLPTDELKKRAIFRDYKRNAIVRGHDFELNREELDNIILQNCFYCGDKPNNTGYTVNKNSDDNHLYKYNGVDRINNELGYTLDNCVSCCMSCNRMKMMDTKEKFFEQIKKIYERHLK